MPSIDQHPSAEQLVAYHERRLAMDEAEDVRAHLAACADCTAQLLALADLLEGDGASAAEEISRSDLDAAWKRQRERLLPRASVASLEERRAGKASRRWSWATAASLGLAAALAIAVVAQWRTIERLEQPQANPPLVNLVPAGSVKRGSREISELRFPRGMERAWVILNPAEDLESSPYGVVITAADGRVVLSLHDLQISEAGNLRLEIPRAALKSGDYKILLLREKGSPHQIIEEYKLTVRHLL
jgi:Putative zinc-finger